MTLTLRRHWHIDQILTKQTQMTKYSSKTNRGVMMSKNENCASAPQHRKGFARISIPYIYIYIYIIDFSHTYIYIYIIYMYIYIYTHTLNVIISSGGRIQDFTQGGGLNISGTLFREGNIWCKTSSHSRGWIHAIWEVVRGVKVWTSTHKKKEPTTTLRSGGVT